MEKEIKQKNHTLTGFSRVVNILRCFFEYATNCTLLTYLVLALIFEWGNFYANIVLTAVTLISTILCFVFNRKFETKERIENSKEKYQKAKHALKWVKILTKLYLIGAFIYSFTITFPKVDILSVISFFWLFYTLGNLIFFEIISLIILKITNKRKKRKLEKKELAQKKA